MSKQSLGSIYKRGTTYWLKYMVNGKYFYESLGCTKKAEAEAERAKRMAPLAAQDRLERVKQVAAAVADSATTAAALAEANRDKLAVADAFEAFKTAPNRSQCGELQLYDYAGRWAKFAAWWKDYAPLRPNMEQVTVADAEAYVAHLETENLSPSRWNKRVQFLRSVFNTLTRQLGNMANPFGVTSAAGIRNRRKLKEGRRMLSEEELRSVCGAATGEMRTLLAVGLYTGLRLHDAACLRWETISLEQLRIIVQPQKTRTSSGKSVVIPLHPVLAAILAETPSYDRRDFVMPKTATMYNTNVSGVSYRLQQMFRAAKITTTVDSGRRKGQCVVGFHSLRHSFVSLSADAGTPLAVLQAIAGHGPMVQELYLHTSDVASRKAVNVLPDVWKPVPPPAPPLALPAPPDPDAAVRAEAVALIATLSGDRLQAALAALKIA